MTGDEQKWMDDAIAKSERATERKTLVMMRYVPDGEDPYPDMIVTNAHDAAVIRELGRAMHDSYPGSVLDQEE